MPKNKSHKGLAKRIKVTKSGKIRFGRPHSRHLKSNKSGVQVQSYRKKGHARSGDIRALSKLLFRPLLSQEQSELREAQREIAVTA
ncbi:MAG: 50S ribosomal protein L35 [Planctomycetaceae bacterium]|jgi:large subunit ribosomal protein L35|nr:50S ribosomal protein L35 [Planctomycetaceae bacterium]